MFNADLLTNSGIEVISIILAYTYTFVLVILTIMKCPLLMEAHPYNLYMAQREAKGVKEDEILKIKVKMVTMSHPAQAWCIPGVSSQKSPNLYT